jgi:hypothetical protein
MPPPRKSHPLVGANAKLHRVIIGESLKRGDPDLPDCPPDRGGTVAKGQNTMELKATVPPFEVPESMVFAHATRLADSWAPAPERIIKPAMAIGPGAMVIRVFDGNTAELGIKVGTKNPLRMLRRLRTLNMSGKYIFDARFDTDANVAHQIDNVASRVLLAKKQLAAALGVDVEIHLLLRSGASRTALEIYRLLGIPVITTDARVEGRIVHTSGASTETWIEGRLVFAAGSTPLVGLLPEIYDLPEIVDRNVGTPEKVYIARKFSRSIANDQEITSLLKSRGFEKYYFEEIPVRQQWCIMGGAREIVSIHGAAMAVLAFNRHGLERPRGDLSGLRVIEVFGAGYIVDMYRRYAAVMNGHWCGVRGQITPEIIRDLDVKDEARAHQASSFRIDPATLEMALEYSATPREAATV